MERKYVSLNKLSHFLSKLKTIFSDINHTHTVVDIENLQDTFNTMQSDIDALEQTVADLEENINPESSFSIETWTFTLVDGTTVSKQVVVK
jgi:peptidoglycan hydrolase CwlO-like protein